MDASGSFSDVDICGLIQSGAISSHSPEGMRNEQVQPASLDLQLSEEAWAIPESFLPERTTVEARIKTYLQREDTSAFSLQLGRAYTLFDVGKIYVVKLEERLRLPKGVRARANPKSSTGRLDIFTRLIVDHAGRYDTVPESYDGPLYLEIVPTSFPIFVRRGVRLSQMRFFHGNPDLDTVDLQALYETMPLLSDRRGKPISPKDAAIEDGGLFMTAHLDSPIVAFSPLRHVQQGIRVDATGRYDPHMFWHPWHRSSDRQLTFMTQEFYLIATAERITVPQGYTAEMVPYDSATGEYRTQYAGFFDPGFGLTTTVGMPATMEVRHFGPPYSIAHGQRIVKITFQRLRKHAARLYGKGSHYTKLHDGPGLSKHFKHWR